MKYRITTFTTAVFLMLPIFGVSTDGRPTYRHAYYLFLNENRNSAGCEDCYVPLLITERPLEQMLPLKKLENCLLITTYERDSIWEFEPFITINGSALNLSKKIIVFRNKSYRYQESDSAEVLRLLKKPGGTIAISRFNAPPDEKTLAPLIQDFERIQGQKSHARA